MFVCAATVRVEILETTMSTHSDVLSMYYCVCKKIIARTVVIVNRNAAATFSYSKVIN